MLWANVQTRDVRRNESTLGLEESLLLLLVKQASNKMNLNLGLMRLSLLITLLFLGTGWCISTGLRFSLSAQDESCSYRKRQNIPWESTGSKLRTHVQYCLEGEVSRGVGSLTLRSRWVKCELERRERCSQRKYVWHEKAIFVREFFPTARDTEKDHQTIPCQQGRSDKLNCYCCGSNHGVLAE